MRSVAVVVVEADEFNSGEGVLCVAVAVAEWDGGVLPGGAYHGCETVEGYSGGCKACGLLQFFMVNSRKSSLVTT